MRFRTRFSVRTLTIVVTLVYAYFGAWEATKRFLPGPMEYFEGTKGDLQKSGQQLCQVINADSPAPFIITRNEIELVRKQHPGYEPYIQPTKQGATSVQAKASHEG